MYDSLVKLYYSVSYEELTYHVMQLLSDLNVEWLPGAASEECLFLKILCKLM